MYPVSLYRANVPGGAPSYKVGLYFFLGNINVGGI
jgi:hypothetical protein